MGESFSLIHTFDHNVDVVDLWTSTKDESPVYVLANNEFYYIDTGDNLVNISSLPNQEKGNTLLSAFEMGNNIFFLCHGKV